jgi:hypothetical protein
VIRLCDTPTMLSRRQMRRLTLPVAVASTALVLAPGAIAAPAPSWNGPYQISFFDAAKDGTSMAAIQPEKQYTDTYVFSTNCSNGPCVATIVGGPAPRNPTVPQPVQYTWDGTAWTQTNDFRWDCLYADGTIEWNPARAVVRYTPQADGSLNGTWHTDILSGTCQGTVDMQMRAVPASGAAEQPT